MTSNEQLKYAVVKFTSEEEISTVPIKWIKNDNECYWPNTSKGLRSMIIRSASPERDWDLTNITIIGKCASYDEALTVEKCVIMAAPRSVQLSNNIVENRENFTDENFSVGQHEISFRNIVKDEIVLSATSNENECAINDDDIEIDENSGILLLADIDEETTLQEVTSDGAKSLDTLQILLNVQSTVQDICKRITNIEEKLNAPELTGKLNFNNSKLYKYLPLKTIQDLLNFENVLLEINMQQEYKTILEYIGGINSKNFVVRALSKVFSDQLSEKCSWKGQKQNFEIRNCKTITFIAEVAYNHYKTTEQEFQLMVMSWFRHGRQRVLKKTKVQIN